MTGRPRTAPARTLVAALALATVLLAGCSGGGEDDAGSAATTTAADAPASTAGGGGEGPDAPAGTDTGSTEPGGVPGTDDPGGPVDLDPRPGEVALEGDATSDAEGARIRIVGTEEEIRVFDADLVVICRPMLGDEEPFEETIRVTIEDISVDADGMVDHVDDGRYGADLLGSFGPDGAFDGSLEVSYEKDADRTCGGRFSFVIG